MLANDAAIRLLEGVPAELLGPPANVFRVSLHPEGLARRTRNFPEWSAYLLSQLHRVRVRSPDPQIESLAEEVAAYPNVAALGGWRHGVSPEEPALLMPWRVEMGGTAHSYFTTLTSFGTPQDITLAELAVELFYPADEPTETALRPSA